MLKERRADDQSVSYGFKTELLTQMDGFHKSELSAVMVIACTNAADRLDPAVRRRLPSVSPVISRISRTLYWDARDNFSFVPRLRALFRTCLCVAKRRITVVNEKPTKKEISWKLSNHEPNS